MANYLPPTQFLPIYNESEYVQMSANLTTTTADARYLKLTGGTETGLVNFNAPINIVDTTQSTTYSTGSVVSAGGLGIAKDSYFNGNINLSGTGTGIHNRDGTVSNPSYSFINEQTSGLYRISLNHLGFSIAGNKIIDYLTTGMSITGNISASGTINPAAGSAANPSLYFGPDTTNGFYRISGGIGFSSSGSGLITFNSLGINNSALTFTERLAVGSGGNTIKLVQFGTDSQTVALNSQQSVGYSVSFPTTFSSNPKVFLSIFSTGGIQFLITQITAISTTGFSYNVTNVGSSTLTSTFINFQWFALN